MKLTHSLVALATLTTLSFAGGDINPVTVFEQEPVVVPVEPVPAPAPAPAPAPVKATPVKPVPVVVPAKNFYFGLGATALKAKTDVDVTNGIPEAEDSQTGITARLGYDFMDYLGAELRGTTAISGEDTGAEKIKQYGAYLKPNIDLTDSLNLYGLLGISKVNMSNPLGSPSDKESGFSYGLGLDYDVSDSFSVFLDAVNYLRKADKNKVYGATLGGAYHF